MAKVANKLQALPVEDDVDITSKIEDVVASAMALIPDRPRGRGTAAATRDSSKELVGKIVKAVVAAVLPMIHSLSTQIATTTHISKEKTQAVLQLHDNRLDDVEQYSRRDNIVFRRGA